MQARSLQGRSVVWLRQSAAHNWPVTSTQQNSIHAQTGQESTRPLGNIQIFIKFSLLVTKTVKRKLTADYLQTVSWDMVKAEVVWLGGGLWGQSRHSSPESPRLGPLLRLQVLQGTGLLLLERGFNSSYEETSFCYLQAREGNSKNIKWYFFQPHSLSLQPYPYQWETND